MAACLYTLHTTLYSLQPTLYTLHSTAYSLQPTLYTLHSVLSKIIFPRLQTEVECAPNPVGPTVWAVGSIACLVVVPVQESGAEGPIY